MTILSDERIEELSGCNGLFAWHVKKAVAKAIKQACQEQEQLTIKEVADWLDKEPLNRSSTMADKLRTMHKGDSDD